jgi:multidrug transporter EmrE-like cation transporter
MPLSVLAMLVASVLMSSSSQIFLKVGMTSSGVQHAIAARDPWQILSHVALSPWIVGGLASFALSLFVWLAVLARIPVSQAYPCVAAGFAVTMLAGALVLGEPVPLLRAAGFLIILLGVAMVATT